MLVGDSVANCWSRNYIVAGWNLSPVNVTLQTFLSVHCIIWGHLKFFRLDFWTLLSVEMKIFSSTFGDVKFLSRFAWKYVCFGSFFRCCQESSAFVLMSGFSVVGVLNSFCDEGESKTWDEIEVDLPRFRLTTGDSSNRDEVGVDKGENCTCDEGGVWLRGLPRLRWVLLGVWNDVSGFSDSDALLNPLH